MKLWVPDGVKVVRGAICQPDYAGLAERSDHQAFARDLEFALIGAARAHPRQPAPRTRRGHRRSRQGHNEYSNLRGEKIVLAPGRLYVACEDDTLLCLGE